MFWEEYRRRPLFLCVCVPFPSTNLAGEAVQSKHRSSALDNIRLDNTAKARQTALLDRRKQAGFMLTSPDHCPPGAAPAGWTSLAGGGASIGEPVTCAVCSLFCAASDESPLSLTASWSGHDDSQAPEIDIQAATRGGFQKKTREIVALGEVGSNWRCAGHWGGGDGEHMRRGPQIRTEAGGDQQPPASATLTQGSSTLLTPCQPSLEDLHKVYCKSNR